MSAQKNTTITLRIPAALKEKIQALADKDNRTLSNMVETIIAEEIERYNTSRIARAAEIIASDSQAAADTPSAARPVSHKPLRVAR